MLRFYDKEKQEILHADQRTYCANSSCLGEPWCSAWGLCKSSQEKMEDEIFKELSQLLEADSSLMQDSTNTSHHLPALQDGELDSKSDREMDHPANSNSRQFAQPKSDREVQQARESGIPAKTKQDTKYCVSLWEAWVEHRRCVNADNVKPITELTKKDLQYWMTRFILEVLIFIY